MIRFIMYLFGKEYENCKSCEILKKQLEFSNSEKRELLETLTRLVAPAPVAVAQSIKLENVKTYQGTFTRRRQALEREAARAKELKQSSPFIAKPDAPVTVKSVEDLEKELGVEDASQDRQAI